MEKITKKYTNGEITVVWKPHLCVHATTCFVELPKVFIPYERPWIKMSGATTDEIMKTVSKCPTQAISFYKNNEESKAREISEINTEISIIKNGPYLIKGSFKIIDVDGNEIVSDENSTALCRCGQTKNRPFCDGLHLQSEFKIDDKTSEGSGIR
jgi:CDGSH-type Zn-finger protein/uncharacterized Fe-S cluster protein YjdI